MPTIAQQLEGKRVGLALASGFFGFFHQTGVLSALVERGIRPVRVTGNSAGAIVASLYAAGLEPEEIDVVLRGVRRADFWDPHWPLTRLGFGFLGGHRLRALLSRSLPVHGFAQCRIPLGVGAYELASGRMHHLEQGALIPAVYASSAVPYLFTPIEIEGHRYWDGGYAEKTPLVPFVKAGDVDIVVISHLPYRDPDRPERKEGFFSFVPGPSALFGGAPREERYERDRKVVAVLREAGVRVLVLAPPRVWLGPFSLDKGAQSLAQGKQGAGAILDSDDEAMLGCPDLS